ncbi:hypothetical protein BD289DRAFT_428096 [Coniella lustricola]|uniref:Uncharacterized protein n=1 Tax=Coniella lustricola TaxID=2025994 RepID=A0A2T3AEB2_9PEZI|nr:hypothetical protein BD289DRAFT_428096 [Coniella lustricola]
MQNIRTVYSLFAEPVQGYPNYPPATSPKTIERQWTDYNPIMSVSDAKMTCNGGASAPLRKTIEAGLNITAI